MSKKLSPAKSQRRKEERFKPKEDFSLRLCAFARVIL
jgi:hypothetical protein